jgi:hypothetical protein
MSDLNRYVHHAERWGTECIYETAASEFGAIELAHLADRLRHIDPKWRLDRNRRDVLIVGLDRAGVPAKRISDQIGVDVRTVRQVLDMENRPSKPALESQEIEQKQLPLTDDLRVPILSPSGA